MQTNKAAISWALYDWANSIFAVTILTGLFPVFFKQYWAAHVSATTSTLYLGTATAIASVVVMIIAPLLGTIADRSHAQKTYLIIFALFGALLTATLYFVPEKGAFIALFIYILSVIGFYAANIFYDALLVSVAADDERHRISALGFALGYLGSGLLFSVFVLMTLKPDWFGLSSASLAIRYAFIITALWWIVFSIPLIRFVKQQSSQHDALFITTWQSLKHTASAILQDKRIFWFLLAYWLYIDGVATIIRMSVDFGLAIGLPSDSLIVAILIVQFVGFPATIVFGQIGHRYGAKTGLWLGLCTYVIATILAVFMQETWHFYALAVVIGLVQGGVQSLSRSLFSRLIPANKSAQYFGFYNIMGKSAALLGPLMIGIFAATTDNSRIGLLSVIVLFLAGMYCLRKVNITQH